MRHHSLLAVAVLLSATPFARAFTITPTFSNNAAQTWTLPEEAVVMEAITDWTSILSYADPHQNINMTFQFTAAGTSNYLGLWNGSYSANVGDNIYPWSPQVTHVVNINTDLMAVRTGFPSLVFTLGGTPVDPNAWDALSVIRHELGHALGLTTLYATDVGNADSQQLLTSHVTVNGTSAVFDQTPGGLNIPLASSTNTEHVADNSDLMSVTLTNGIRKNMSFTDIEELSLTEGYAVTIPSGTTFTSTTFKTQTITLNGTVSVSSTTAARNTAATVLSSKNLTINSGGLLNLSNHDLIISAGQTLASVRSLVTSGFGTGTLNGSTGITSSTASASGTTFGFATASALGVSTFDGLAVNPTDILVKYTYAGDANLDGKVDLNDLNIVLNNLGTTNSNWSSGNFDGLATIDLTDLNNVLNHLGASVLAGSSVVATADASVAGSSSAVPEPASLSVMALGAVMVLQMRRK